MSEPILEEIRDLTLRIGFLQEDLEGAIGMAHELGYTSQQIAAAQTTTPAPMNPVRA